MKEFKCILSKLFKKQTIPLLLLTMLMVLFFVNLFNRPVAYASEQMAFVRCDVFVLDDDVQEVIATDNQIVSNFGVSEIDFSDINVELNAHSKLEFVYSIENITTKNCSFNLKLNDDNIQNIKIEYFIDDCFVGDLTKFDYVLATAESVEIKVVAYVDNVTCNASLNGNLALTFESVGE